MTGNLLPEGVNIAHPEKLYIGGQWVSPSGGGTIEIVSPNTEQVVGRVAEAREADMDSAVAAARTAFEAGPWPTLPVAERARYLRAMAAHLEKRQGELTAAYVAQIGVLVTMAPGMMAQGTANFTKYADIGEHYDWVKQEACVMPGHVGYVVREPVGVVAAIAPWNVPYVIMTQKVAPALIAGNTVVMKPSPETPLEAYLIAEAADAVGLPAGVLNLVPSHREAADHLVCNPGVDKVSFTGSTVAGRRIATVCGERIARVTLELGGKSAAIVADDMPTPVAARILARTITILSGQVCAMLSRAIVPAHRHDELAAAIAEEMRAVKIGYSTDPASEMGPLAMKRQLERVEGYIARGKAEGADLLQGGGRPSHLNRGFFIEPTLFGNVDNRSTIAQEEIFGPVLSLIKADDMDHAIALANDSNYGLNGAVLTNDVDTAYKVARRIRTGNVAQNGMKADFNLPFGGFKQSGIGREGGVEGLMPYVETKTLILEAAPAAAAAQ